MRMTLYHINIIVSTHFHKNNNFVTVIEYKNIFTMKFPDLWYKIMCSITRALNIYYVNIKQFESIYNYNFIPLKSVTHEGRLAQPYRITN